MEKEIVLREFLPDNLALICFEYINPARIIYNHVVSVIKFAGKDDNPSSTLGRTWIKHMQLAYAKKKRDSPIVRNYMIRQFMDRADYADKFCNLFGGEDECTCPLHFYRECPPESGCSNCGECINSEDERRFIIEDHAKLKSMIDLL